MFPQEFELPSGHVSQVWQQWCCGDADQGLPPLKSLQPTDLQTRNARKRLSDLKFLMAIIESKAVELSKMKPRLNIVEAIEIFEACKDEVDVPETSSKNRKRRTSQLSWITVATLKRKKEAPLIKNSTTTHNSAADAAAPPAST